MCGRFAESAGKFRVAEGVGVGENRNVAHSAPGGADL